MLCSRIVDFHRHLEGLLFARLEKGLSSALRCGTVIAALVLIGLFGAQRSINARRATEESEIAHRGETTALNARLLAAERQFRRVQDALELEEAEGSALAIDNARLLDLAGPRIESLYTYQEEIAALKEELSECRKGKT